MSPDEITRRLLDHYGTSDGWRQETSCRCNTCADGWSCSLPELFQALCLPVPEPTAPAPPPRPAVTRVDMGSIPMLDLGIRGGLIEFVSNLNREAAPVLNLKARGTHPLRPTPPA